MEVFAEFLVDMDNSELRGRTKDVFQSIAKAFPKLEPVMKWNQPMFTDHGTFIIAFSVARHHLAVSPEQEAIGHFSNAIVQAGYTHTKNLIRIPWDRPIDISLLEKIIAFNIQDKVDCSTFWRES